MTALEKYQRLECPGLWREAPGEQRRDVVVSFGEASLVISDGRRDMALSHWSLPATLRLNPGMLPALYSPDTDATETLEIDDPTMIAALETVHDAVEAQRPHPGRMRNLLLGAALVAVLVFGIFWMPSALVRHTAEVVPFSKRQEIGQMVLADLARVSGKPCARRGGLQSLAKLTTKLFGKDGTAVTVLRDLPIPAAHLPGNILVLNRALIEGYDGPEVAAGYLVAESIRSDLTDPLETLLHWAGTRATFHLLTTGDLPPAAIHGYAEAMMATVPDTIADAVLLTRFQRAGVPTTPYAHALDPTGRTTGPITAADPFAAKPARPLLTDGEWVNLQGICG